MSQQWIIVFLPIMALAVNVFIQIIMVHVFSRINFSIVCGILAGLTSLIITSICYEDKAGIENLMVNIPTYFALSFCFFAFLNLNLTSLRIRVVRELNHADESAMPLQQLVEYYSPQELYARRISRLVKSNQILQSDGRWYLQSKKLLILVFVSNFLRQLILPGINK